MSTYKIHRKADGAIGGYGPDNEQYKPYLEDGDTLEYSDEVPEIPVIVDYKAESKSALVMSDLVALRCFKNGVSFPTDWINYCAELRTIVVSGVGPIPVQPAYPKGS